MYRRIFRTCGAKLKINYTKFITLCSHRAPSGNLHSCFELLDETLKHLEHTSTELVLW